jgi:D-lactate dehydratase
MLQFLSGSDKAVFGDPKHPFNVKLHSRLKKASELKSEDYGLFFASAGHAALYDYPTAKDLQAVAADIWDRGGMVVCHGPAILPGIIDPKTGKSIIEGKTVTEDKVTLVVDAVTGVGAFYSSSMGAMDDYSITCGRLVTGTNPASGSNERLGCTRSAPDRRHRLRISRTAQLVGLRPGNRAAHQGVRQTRAR